MILPDAVAEGFYTVKDGAVLLVDEMGNAIDRFKLYRKLKAGEDAHGVAASLLRQWKRPRGSDFSRPLRYPRIAY